MKTYSYIVTAVSVKSSLEKVKVKNCELLLVFVLNPIPILRDFPNQDLEQLKGKKLLLSNFFRNLLLILWSSEAPLKDFNVVQKYSLNISVEGPAAN